MRPLVRDWWLTRVTRLRRAGLFTGRGLLISVFAVALAVAMLIALTHSAYAVAAFRWASAHPVLVVIAATLYAALLVSRQRAHLRLAYSQSWLRATPLPGRAFASMQMLRISVSVVLHIALCGIVIVSSAHAADLPSQPILKTLLGGLLLGTGLGAIWPQAASNHASEDSRFISRVRTSSNTPSLCALSRWPVAKALAWHRPENSRFLFVIAALSVPVGSSALIGLAILATWSLVSYLVALMRAIPAVAREAALWLRPTVIPFTEFAWSIARRALWHQLVGTVVLASIFTALGAALIDTIYFAALWMSVVAMTAATSLRQQYLRLPSLSRNALALLLVVIAESRERGWGAMIALAWTVAHVRGPLRARS